MWLIAIIAILLSLWFFITWLKAYRIKTERCILFTGSMGSGKTLMAVNLANRLYGYQTCQQLKRKLRHPISYKWQKHYIYSNIPLSHKRYKPLTADILLKNIYLEEYSVVLMDEVGGTIADQYSYESRVVTEYLNQFIRFSRHWFDGFVILTDQSADSVPKVIRDRVSAEYHLSKCRSFFGLWKKIDILPILHLCEGHIDEQDRVQKTDKKDGSYKSEYILAKVPRGAYYSRCYRWTYRKGFVFRPGDDIRQPDEHPLSTRLYIDIEPTPEESKLYKEDKKKGRNNILSKNEQMFEKPTK